MRWGQFWWAGVGVGRGFEMAVELSWMGWRWVEVWRWGCVGRVGVGKEVEWVCSGVGAEISWGGLEWGWIGRKGGVGVGVDRREVKVEARALGTEYGYSGSKRGR